MNLNKCKYDFASDTINIITLVYDKSVSMTEDTLAMRSANDAFYKDFSKFEEKGSIAISKATFDNYCEMSPFLGVSEFDTSYYALGGTALYRAISTCANNTIRYYNEIVKRLNVCPRITFLVFSDGVDLNNYKSEFTEAKNAITELNSLDATTVFVAFREAKDSDIGNKLGFTCTRDINSTKELISCLGGELSKSCKEQSKSIYSLKSEFFSKASADSNEDNTDESPIMDDDFFNI